MDGQPYTTSLTYDALDRRDTVTLPDLTSPEVLIYSYDGTSGLLSQVPSNGCPQPCAS